MKVCNHDITGYVRLIVRSALGENRDAVVPGEVVPHHGEHLVIVDVREELAITRIAMAHNHVVVLAGLDGRGLALHVVDQNVLVAEDFLHDVVAIVQLRLTRPRRAYRVLHVQLRALVRHRLVERVQARQTPGDLAVGVLVVTLQRLHHLCLTHKPETHQLRGPEGRAGRSGRARQGKRCFQAVRRRSDR